MDKGTSRDRTRTGSRSLLETALNGTAALERRTIRNSLFFNSAHYLETNPDVRATGWTLPSTTWFMEVGKAETPGHFLDQSLSRPVPRCRRSRRQRAPALRNPGTPRKQNCRRLASSYLIRSRGSVYSSTSLTKITGPTSCRPSRRTLRTRHRRRLETRSP